MDIDKLEAGRELDAMVATKIFGHRLIPQEEQWDRVKASTSWPVIRVEGTTESSTFTMPAYYSTDIDDAWRVVDKLIELGWHPTVWYEPAGDESWACELMTYKDYEGGWPIGLAPTAPLAICRAALKVVQNNE